MKTVKNKLPRKATVKLYSFKKTGDSVPQNESYGTDMTTPCTTFTTTTHF
jgi:hypothetical protein